MRFATIVSGSSGNCVYVGTDRSGVLIDGGCSLKTLRAGLAALRVEESSLAALLITHEHTDHISGAQRISRHLHIPIFATEQVWEKLPFREDFFSWERHTFHYGMEIGALGVEFIKLSHDAVQPLSFVFCHKDQRVAVATDTGEMTRTMRELAAGADGLVLEANHDLNMLMRGPYPRRLKERVASGLGHLSNAQAGEALSQLSGPATRSVILAHLSATNNQPALALDTVERAMENCPYAEHIDITVAPRYQAHPLVDLDR